MKRLTIRNSCGSVSQPTDLKWAETLELLASYEDTGLTPEEIKELMHDILHGKLGEWIDAERDGRLAVLPCKAGDTVYGRDLEPYTVVSTEWVSGNVHYLHCVHPATGRRNTFSVGKRSIGKTVFLTREAAEKALKGGSDHA